MLKYHLKFHPKMHFGEISQASPDMFDDAPTCDIHRQMVHLSFDFAQVITSTFGNVH